MHGDTLEQGLVVGEAFKVTKSEGRINKIVKEMKKDEWKVNH